MNQAEAADYIRLTPRYLRTLVSEGKVKAHRLKGGRSIRFDVADLDALLRPIPTVGTMGGRSNA